MRPPVSGRDARRGLPKSGGMMDVRAEYEALRAAVNASGDCTDPEHGESCACHADVMLRNLHAEIKRLRTLNDEQRISDALTFSEMLKRKEAEVVRLRADLDRAD